MMMNKETMKSGDKVRTRYGKIETVVCVNKHGNVVTRNSRGYIGGEYHPANITLVK